MFRLPEKGILSFELRNILKIVICVSNGIIKAMAFDIPNSNNNSGMISYIANNIYILIQID